MVITKIQFGLGNQLFQYALGKRMAQERQEELYIEKFWYSDHYIDPTSKVRSFQLYRFNTNLKAISRSTQYRFFIPGKNIVQRVIRKVAKKSNLYPPKGYLVEKEDEKFSCSERILNAKERTIFLHGVWACIDYFQPVLDELRTKDYTFRNTPDQFNQPIAQAIKSTNSVAVHIRKGDYLTGRFTNYLGNICSPSYYQTAFKYIKERLEDPFFFIFSDDFQWVKQHIQFLDNYEFVNINDEANGYKDLQLMTFCKHNIIANSTFSYWGALLGQEKKLVIAPKKWHSQDFGQVKLYPKEWVTIE